MSSAQRQARARRRARDGLIVVPVELSEDALAKTLIALGRLDEQAALNPDKLRSAGASLIREIIEPSP